MIFIIMGLVEKNCLTCNKLFLASAREHNRGNAKYCSLSCASKGNKVKKEPNLICSYCGIGFHRSNSKIKNSKSGYHFCCREHKDLAQKLENGFNEIQPNHYGTGTGISSYRVKVFETREKKCERCGYDEHPEILEVHHKDRNRDNNEESNLEILCPNCHMWDHYSNEDGRYKKNINRGIGIDG